MKESGSEQQVADQKNVALLVIDVQQGLFRKSLYRAEELLHNINTLIDRAHRGGVSVFFIQHSGAKTLVKGSQDWQLHPQLHLLATDPIVHKQHGNAFEDTALDEALKSGQATDLVVTGLVTHGCVRATCIGALELGYRVILVKDGHSNFSRQPARVIEEWNQKLRAMSVELKATSEIEFGESVNQTSGSSDPKHIVEQGYDRVAYDYARLEGEAVWPRLRWLRKLLDRLEPGSSVLDLGCGSGDPADIEVAEQHQITGVDISQTQIDLARQNVPAGHFLHADAGSVQFPAASFDAVISFYSLEHIPRQEHETVLRRIYDWLRPGGFLLISMEADDIEEIVAPWLGVPMFMSCFDPDTMKRLVVGVGFELVETDIESQVEQGHDIPYLWLLACKRSQSDFW